MQVPFTCIHPTTPPQNAKVLSLLATNHGEHRLIFFYFSGDSISGVQSTSALYGYKKNLCRSNTSLQGSHAFVTLNRKTCLTQGNVCLMLSQWRAIITQCMFSGFPYIPTCIGQFLTDSST